MRTLQLNGRPRLLPSSLRHTSYQIETHCQLSWAWQPISKSFNRVLFIWCFCCWKMSNSRSFWNHVESVTTLTMLIAQSCNSVHPMRRELCSAMNYLSTHHVSIHGWKRAFASVGDMVEYRESPVEITNALLYILDAFVPLLNALCLQLHKQLRATSNSSVIGQLLTEEKKDKLRAFGKAILVICLHIPSFLWLEFLMVSSLFILVVQLPLQALSNYKPLFSLAIDRLQKFCEFLSSLLQLLIPGMKDMHLIEVIIAIRDFPLCSSVYNTDESL